MFLFTLQKQAGVLIAVQPTSIYLILGKYTLNVSGMLRQRQEFLFGALCWPYMRQ